jgi:hypothetical protein
VNTGGFPTFPGLFEIAVAQRSRAVGCQWASQFAQHDDTRRLLRQLANQWHAMANQLDLMEALGWCRVQPEVHK